MEGLSMFSSVVPFRKVVKTVNHRHNFNFTVKSCSGGNTGENAPLSGASSAYSILGVHPTCSPAELKAAFRDKIRVKQFHPDVNRNNGKGSDTMIRRVIQAYEMLSNFSRSEIIEEEFLDPFDNPECQAFDVFVNEALCVGKGCPYSCVQRAPHALLMLQPELQERLLKDSIENKLADFDVLKFETGLCMLLGHGEDYQVQLAVGQCPRSCIHYVTPSQRIVLEELLDSILSTPFDSSAEADLLYSLIVKARFENNRYRKTKKQPKASTQHVDWY